MGDPVPISFGSGSRKTRYGLEGVAEWVNAYMEDLGDGTKTGTSGYAINGTELFSTLAGGGAVRGLLDLDDRLLAVAGRTLYSVPFSGVSPATVGGITADGFVTMERNRRTDVQAVIVASGFWWIYQSGVLTQGTDPDLSPPLFVIQKDGYFIFGHDSGKWSISGVDDITISGLDFAEAESNADGLIMGAVRGPDVILFGPKSTEFWSNTGAQDFPFTRTLAINMGCWCAGSVRALIVQRNSSLVDSVAWAATDNAGAFAGVYMLNGFTPLKISTDQVDRLIRDEPDKTIIRATSWTEDGHVFYSISGAAWTETFDTRTGNWHGRKSLGCSGRWRYATHAFFGGQHIFGHYNSNTLYVSKPTLFTDAGDEIEWSITTPTVHMSPYRFKVNALHVGALTGVGAVTGPDESRNPTMLLDYTKDGGQSYAAARRCALGAAGQRGVRIKERMFGMFGKNGLSIRMRSSASVMKGLQELAIDFDKMAA